MQWEHKTDASFALAKAFLLSEEHCGTILTFLPLHMHVLIPYLQMSARRAGVLQK